MLSTLNMNAGWSQSICDITQCFQNSILLCGPVVEILTLNTAMTAKLWSQNTKDQNTDEMLTFTAVWSTGRLQPSEALITSRSSLGYTILWQDVMV